MPYTLIAEEFGESKLGKVAGVHCGNEPWALFAAQWIQAPQDMHGALKSIAQWGNKVWLYFDADSDQLVGFGSLGSAVWPNYQPHAVSIIPQLAIHANFHGKPLGAGEIRFSHQLLDDLIARAIALEPRRLVLTVDPGNEKARYLYREFGFEELPDLSPRGHVKMTLLLPEPFQNPAVSS
ncbi:MAG: GNAT family N-acetyltransferase [Pirellulaceae bacterium]